MGTVGNYDILPHRAGRQPLRTVVPALLDGVLLQVQFGELSEGSFIEVRSASPRDPGAFLR